MDLIHIDAETLVFPMSEDTGLGIERELNHEIDADYSKRKKLENAFYKWSDDYLENWKIRDYELLVKAVETTHSWHRSDFKSFFRRPS